MSEKMTPEEALAELKKIADCAGDTERDHSEADEVLCALLRFYGQEEVVKEFEALDKWYA